MEAATAIFGTDDLDEIFADLGDEEEVDEMDEDIDLIEMRKERLRLYEEAFGSTALESMFVSEYDEDIVKKDIPERLQLRFGDRPTPSAAECKAEARWIIKNKLTSLMVRGDEASLVERVAAVLEQMLVHHMEIPFIFQYAQDLWYQGDPSMEVQEDGTNLNIANLWIIYEEDKKWMNMTRKKEQIIKLYESILKKKTGDNMDIDVGSAGRGDNDVLLEMVVENTLADIREEFTSDGLGDYSEHFRFHHLSSLPTRYKLPGQSGLPRRVRQHGLLPYCELFGLSSVDYAHNVLKGQFLTGVVNHELEPLPAARDFVNTSSGGFKSVTAVLMAARAYLAEEFSVEPLLRSFVRKYFTSNACISTKPTPTGHQNIDPAHRFATVKSLNEKPMSLMLKEDDMQFALVYQAHQDKLIEYEISLPLAAYSELETKLNFFYSEEGTDTARKWNRERLIVVRTMIKKYLLPSLTREAQKTLFEHVSEEIVRQCSMTLEKMTFQGPFIPADDPELVDNGKFNVMAVSYAQFQSRPPSSTAVVILNDQGEYQEHLNVSLVRDYTERETEQIRALLDKYRPAAIAVGADSWGSRRAYDDLNLIAEIYSEENGGVYRPAKIYLNPAAAHIFALSERAQVEFEGLAEPILRAISLGRMLLDPLPELAALVNKEAELTNLPLHPMQSLVPSDLLQERLERYFVFIVNEVGVDLAKCVANPRVAPLLKFVCGLGPRKARRLIQKYTQAATAPHTREALLYDFLGETVHRNAAGFLKFKFDPYANFEQNLLDSYKIHPEDYDYALKIAHTIDENQDLSDREVLEGIALRGIADDSDIDLQRFAEIIREKRQIEKLHTLHAIMAELPAPFEDSRVFEIPPRGDVFDWLTRSTSRTLYEGLRVTVRVRPIRKRQDGEPLKAFNVDIQELGIPGICSMRSLPSDMDPQRVEAGALDNSLLPAIISMIKKDEWVVFVNLNQAEIDERGFGIRQIGQLESYLRLESFENMRAEEKAEKIRFTRALHHPHFKNFTHEDAKEYMSDKEPGEIIIRPSSRGWDQLKITWKFAPDIITELDVVELDKPNNWSLGKRLVFTPGPREVVYEDLNELVVSCLDPLTVLADDVVHHRKFQDTPLRDLSKKLVLEKKSNSASIPYYITYARKHPGRFLLCYLPRKDVIREHISLTPEGLYFRHKEFPEPRSIEKLLNWFKRHYKDPIRPKPNVVGTSKALEVANRAQRPANQPEESALNNEDGDGRGNDYNRDQRGGYGELPRFDNPYQAGPPSSQFYNQQQQPSSQHQQEHSQPPPPSSSQSQYQVPPPAAANSNSNMVSLQPQFQPFQPQPQGLAPSLAQALAAHAPARAIAQALARPPPAQVPAPPPSSAHPPPQQAQAGFDAASWGSR
eukprot:TRINITY_DN3768_c0_g1_i1.p1 TRINITY_DN3768_c0_g1~~TRINITY_DN3768_c0_g1_i1.p1  ORF type:complete len:1532 (-),score=343.18 TRINITY_DN3768_c0_g1_i1:152-4300(-)